VTPEGSPLSTANAKQEGLVRSAGVVSISVLLSRITGLVREIVMARLFGASGTYDAFLLGFRIPNLTRDLFAEGALSSAFVPVFTRYLATKEKREAAELSNLVATAVVLVVGVICVAGMIFSPQLVRLMVPGFAAIPGKFEMAVKLTRIMFPFLLLVALAAQAMGVLNACNQFGVPALASTFFNIGSVIFGLVLGVWLGPVIGITRIEGMAYGVVIGGAWQLFWQIPSLLRAGFRYRPRLDFSHPGLRNIMRLMVPAIVGSASVQINVMVNTNFASTITDAAGHVINGPVSWLSYAFRFMQLPLGLFGVAIASATLPSISRSAATQQMGEFRDTLARSLGMVLLLTVPASVGLAVLGKSMIAAVYQGGALTASDTEQIALALSCYAVGLCGYAAVKILAPALYTLDDARTPMLVSLASIAVNYAAASSMIRFAGLGHAGLALSTSLVASFSAVALLEAIRRRIGGIDGRQLMVSFGKIAMASIVMGVVCFAANRTLEMYLGVSRWMRLMELAVAIPLGLAVFYAICRLSRLPELESAQRALLPTIARRLGLARAKIS
jgi:putative peptidoglycan lipid II flippase